MINVLNFLSEVHACGFVRGIVPARAINIAQAELRVTCSMDLLPCHWPRTDLMVFSRKSSEEWVRWLEEATKRGIPVIYEIDDDVWNVPPEFTKPHDFYSKADVRGAMARIVNGCAAVTVSTPELADVVRHEFPTARIFIIPNAVEPAMWAAAYAQREERLQRMADQVISAPEAPVVIGWHASNSHLMDLELLHGVLPMLLSAHPRLRLHLIGWVGFKDIPGLQPFGDRVFAEGWTPQWELPYKLASFDIGIAPLMPNAWNISKSPQKFLEYSIMGVPCVASPAPCYESVIEPGVNGMLPDDNDPTKWYACLDALIRDVNLRRSMGSLARQRLLAGVHNIENSWKLWDQVFRLVASWKDEKSKGQGVSIPPAAVAPELPVAPVSP